MVITSYEGLDKCLNSLLRINFQVFVIDEAHKLKNDESVFFDIVKRVRTNYRLLLTGTPLSNKITELWALLNFIMPDEFSDRGLFENFFELNQSGKEGEEKIRQIHRVMEPFMLRRLKHDTSLNLPPKKEIYVYCPMSKLQKTIYQDCVTGLIQKTMTQSKTNNLFANLRKCAIHPYLFPEYDTIDEEFGEHLFKVSGKFTILDKMIKKFINEKQKILIFSQFTSVLNILEDCLVTRKVNYLRLDGTTDNIERNEAMQKFNAKNYEYPVFMLSTRAGGLGITLVSANIVIFLDSDWNPQMDMQAMDRAHRIGQTSPVFVYRLITKHTIEEKIIEKQALKLKMDYLIIERGRKINQSAKENLDFDLTKLNATELKDLAYFGANQILTAKEEGKADV